VCVCTGNGQNCGDAGTCIDTNRDNANCGACGNACQGGTSCKGGQCR
jgi:hypothetical protein